MSKQKHHVKIARHFSKATSLLRVAFLFMLWSIGFMAITNAVFLDIEGTSGNTFATGTLDMTVTSPQTNFTPEPGGMTPDTTVTRDVTISNSGSLPLFYQGQYLFTSGDTQLCDALSLTIKKDATTLYTGPLTDFSEFSSPGTLVPNASDSFVFSVTLPASTPVSMSGKTCTFTFPFVGWQTDTTQSLAGFIDSETLDGNVLGTADFEAPPAPTLYQHINDVVVNSSALKQCWEIVSDPQNLHNPVTYEYESYNDALMTSLRYKNSYSESANKESCGSFGMAIVKHAEGAPEGHVYHRVRAVDSVGNASSWSSAHFLIDNTAPTTAISVSNSPARTITEDVKNSSFELIDGSGKPEDWINEGDVSVITGSELGIAPHDGNRMVKIGTDTEPGQDYTMNFISQPIPNSAKNISFWYNFLSYDYIGYDEPGFAVFINDKMVYQMWASDIATAANPDSSGWHQFLYDISSVSQTEAPILTIVFHAGNTDIPTLQSWVYVDNVSTADVVVNRNATFTLTPNDNLTNTTSWYQFGTDTISPIFSDNFNDGNTNGWWLGPSNHTPLVNGNWRIENGTLVQDQAGDDFIALVENHQISNQIIETQLKTFGPSGYGGVSIWYQDTFHWTNLIVYPAIQKIVITERTGERSEDFLTKQYASTYADICASNCTLKVKANSATGKIDIYINNTYLFSHTATTSFRSGQAGLINGNAGGYFDNFNLSSFQPPSGGIIQGTKFQLSTRPTGDVISYWSVDEAGNKETEKTLRVIFDNDQPDSVSDLSVIDWTDGEFSLNFTSVDPHDTVTGNTTATAYDVRFATTPITNDTEFNAATATESASPKPAGEPERIAVKGLEPNNQYWFAVKVKDAAPNWSLLTDTSKATNGPTVVLNEFMPDPTGADNAAKPDGEWIELYNNASYEINVDGWILYDSEDANELPITSANTNTGDTTIPAGGFLVVYKNGDGDFTLNNTVDSIRLANKPLASGGRIIDSYTYSSVTTNKSYARIPDGTGPWIDPIGTPGAENSAQQGTYTIGQHEPDDFGILKLPSPMLETTPDPTPTESSAQEMIGTSPTITPTPTDQKETDSATPSATPTDSVQSDNTQ